MSRSKFELRPYQKEALASIPEAGAFLIQMAVGLGKTVTFSQIPRRGRMLILSHRDELVHQPQKYFDCSFGVEQAGETSHDEEVVSASVQSLVRRLDKFKPDDFDVLVTDECFPAGTLVDGKPIEEIKVGDYVTAFNHKTMRTEKRKVINTFKNLMPDTLVKINNALICTANHPIYEIGKGEYINAKGIKAGNCLLYCMQCSDFMEQYAKKQKRYLSQKRTCLLFNRMSRRLSSSYIVRNNEYNKQKICFRQNESAQSYEQSSITSKDVRNIAQNRAQALNQRRQWKRINISSENVYGTMRLFQSCKRVYCQDWGKKDQPRAFTKSLQNRRGVSRFNACSGNRRRQSLFNYQKGTGFKEREFFKIKRVDSVEILEQKNLGEYGRLCASSYVYNLEVEGLNNYFANGYLVHNCQHAAAPSYRKIYDYFKPRLHLGFTATPNRNDGIGLQDIYQDIIFQRDLKWGIQNGYLSDIHCLRVNIGYDLRRVAVRLGDFASDELDKAVNVEKANKAVAEAYERYAKPPCLIFCASVSHAENLAELIPGAVAVRGGEDREQVVQDFKDGKIPCLTNCMVFTEGTDIPNINTIIMARPTKNASLYQQAIGRGTRLYPGKDHVLIIDCVGISRKVDLCTAPSLIGLDISEIPPRALNELQGDLFDLPDIAMRLTDCPEAWIRNVEYVDVWARNNNYNMHGVNFFKHPDGTLTVLDIQLPPEDSLGRIEYDGELLPAQKVFDLIYEKLKYDYQDKKALWDLDLIKKWGDAPASDKQKDYVKSLIPALNVDALTKFEASQILARKCSIQEPATQKQKYFLRMHGFDTANLTKREAMRMIREIKG